MKTKSLFFLIASVILASCGKDDTNSPNTAHDPYMNANDGSSWTYHEVNSSGDVPIAGDYTITSTANDTTINSRKYHVYNYSYGGNQYLNVSGSDYYQFDSIPGGVGGNVERLYLKDNAAVGATWDQDFIFNIPDFPIAIPLTVSNTIIDKGNSRTVNGITYSNVIHVSTTLSSAFITTPSEFTSSIDSYYAENYGLIENSTLIHIHSQGLEKDIDIKTQLMSAVLK